MHSDERQPDQPLGGQTIDAICRECGLTESALGDMLPPEVRTEFCQTFASKFVPLGAATFMQGCSIRATDESRACSFVTIATTLQCDETRDDRRIRGHRYVM